MMQDVRMVTGGGVANQEDLVSGSRAKCILNEFFAFFLFTFISRNMYSTFYLE
jgi:hypothetical protein